MISNVAETLKEAVETFYLDRPGKPVLVPTGIAPLDRALGGLGPGACGILAAATGVGKSSTMLAAMLNSPVPVGCVSVEDTPDVVGTRILSARSGIDSLRIRRKDLSKAELKRLNDIARNPADMSHMFFAYPIAGHITKVEECIKELTDAGCKLIWLDYVQEVVGTREKRNEEVGEVMRRCHGQAALGGAALMVVSQFRRIEADRVPGIHHLKESGDLENKARIILLAHRVTDPHNNDRVRFRLAKSTYGGEHVTFDMVRDASGTLQEADFLDVLDDF